MALQPRPFRSLCYKNVTGESHNSRYGIADCVGLRFMEHFLRAEDWKTLTAPQRASRCHKMAEVCRTSLIGADPQMRLELIKMAERWLGLADEIERQYYATMR